MDDSLEACLKETALDLYRSGLMSEATLREFNVLSLANVKPLSARQIRKLRRNQKVSQAVFAALLNVSKSTVQQWEQGKKKPGGASLKLLNLVREKGLDALL